MTAVIGKIFMLVAKMLYGWYGLWRLWKFLHHDVPSLATLLGNFQLKLYNAFCVINVFALA